MTRIARSLDAGGNAVLPQLLTGEQCKQLVDLCPRQDIYRSTVVMARHGFARGEYKYFAYPLPELLQQLRGLLYPALVTSPTGGTRCSASMCGIPIRTMRFLRDAIEPRSSGPRR